MNLYFSFFHLMLIKNLILIQLKKPSLFEINFEYFIFLWLVLDLIKDCFRKMKVACYDLYLILETLFDYFFIFFEALSADYLIFLFLNQSIFSFFSSFDFFPSKNEFVKVLQYFSLVNHQVNLNLSLTFAGDH